VAKEDCEEGGGWDADEDCWLDAATLAVEACEVWEEEDGLVEVVGTKEERFVATARAERRADIVVNYYIPSGLIPLPPERERIRADGTETNHPIL